MTSPLILLSQLKSNYMWSLHGVGEQKFVHNVWVTWPRRPSWSYMVKTFENLLLKNRMAGDLETWYTALETRVLPYLFKWWPLVDPDLFYSKVKFQSLGLLYGKKTNSGFFLGYCSLWYHNWYLQSAKWFFINTKVKVIYCKPQMQCFCLLLL